jgi:ADP-heptose:LPS heptosyltransferase
MKILAIKLRAIGDTAIWTAALDALHAQYPDAVIHVLTHPANAAVLENSKSVDEIHTVAPGSKFELLRALWRMRGESFDWLLAFHATKSLCRWAWVASARKQVLHHHSWGYTPRGSERLDKPGALMDAIERDLEVLRAMGFEPRRLPTHIEIKATERDWAENIVAARIRGVGGDPAKPRMAFLPGAAHPLRRYPRDLWLPLLAKTKAEGRFEPLVMCDAALAEQWNLAEECKKLNIPLFARGPLREFITIVSRAERALANDSGPGHIAVACGLQTDFVFGPGCVGDWFPYRDTRHKVHRVDVDCRLNGPAHLEKFRFCTVDKCEHHSCLRKLTIALD